MSEDCKINDLCDSIHQWVHFLLDDANPRKGDMVEGAHKLAHSILDLLNDGAGAKVGDGVKVLALYQILATGIEMMDENAKAAHVQHQWGMKSKGVN